MPFSPFKRTDMSTLGETVNNMPDPAFDFQEERDRVFNVFTKTGNSKDRLCTIHEYQDSKRGHYYCIRQTHPPEYDDVVNGLTFTTKEQAARFFYQARFRIEATVAAVPLKDNVMEYIVERLRQLHDRERNFQTEFIMVRRERYDLAKIAKANGIERAQSFFDTTGPADCLRKLVNYKVQIKNPKKGKHQSKYVEVTLIEAWYELFGKDEGRTLRNLLAEAFNDTVPGVVQELNL